MSNGFVHLHVHTEYSLLDGAARIDQLVRQAADLGMNALAVTDHGTMYGVVDFFLACRRQGIRPIIGCEAYLAPRLRTDRTPRMDDDPSHLVLLAADLVGYGNLVRLVSRGFLEGYYYKPRIDMELLAEHSEGLIALSACLAGRIPRQLMAGDEAGARATAGTFIDIFGRDRFFIEMQDQNLPEQRELNPQLVSLARNMDLGLVATNDVHYVNRSDASAHDVLLCIQTARKIDDVDRLRFPNDGFYLKSPTEMAAAFARLPEAIANSAAIAERCEVEFELGQTRLPRFPVPEGTSAEELLSQKCRKLLPARYPTLPFAARDRLDYELEMINRMGFADYFLIVSDFVDFARSRGIPVGPGRGSVAGSLVAYALGITNIDPLRFGLLFERFLNPDRVTLPDMDIDFCFERRGEVIEYVVRRYGKESVAQIITFGTMAARAAIRDVGRALDMPYSQVDRIAKLVPAQVGMTLGRALDITPELRRAGSEDAEVGRLIELARAVEGLPRHASVHAAGVVIADRPLLDYVPLQKTADESVVTQYPMGALEQLGLLKMDFLALRTLTLLKDCVDRIRRDRGVDIDLDCLSFDDEATFSMLGRGEAQGVFQLEASWIREILRDMKPSRFEDIIALGALCRPGPMEHIPEYIANKRKGVTYLHPELEPILAETYGVIVYQEQVMQVASRLAGFSLAQADVLRWAMGKKKPELIADMREAFMTGTADRGIPRDAAEEIFHLIDRFSGYGFNKSHAAAYAVVVYQTAYLKANYPLEFMASLLTSVMASSDKVAGYIADCRRMGIPVLPPDINVSLATFTVAGTDIRFGLSAVKNVGSQTIEAIVSARTDGPFRSLRDFCERVDHRHLNRRALDSLIKSGAFDSLGDRGQLLAMSDRVLDAGSEVAKMRSSGQLSLFDSLGTDEPEDLGPVPQQRVTEEQSLAMEKEVLGLYISGHPLGRRAHELDELVDCPLSDLPERPDNSAVRVGGLVVASKRIATKNGQSMAFVTIEDLGSTTEVVVFPRLLEQAGEWLVPDEVVLVRGRVSAAEEETKVVAEDIQRITRGSRVVLDLALGDEFGRLLRQLRELLCGHEGMSPVYVKVDGDERQLLCGRDLWVTPGPSLWEALDGLLGPGRTRQEES